MLKLSKAASRKLLLAIAYWFLRS